MPRYHEYTAEDLLHWDAANSPIVRVNTMGDTVLGTLAAAMLPIVVRWTSSSPGFGEDDFYVASNVNVEGNPIRGSNWLATVRIPGNSVKSVEFVTVMSKLGPVETEVGHSMLRFIFHDDRRPVILTSGEERLTGDSELADLVVSWEAWRPPRSSFDPISGLDPTSYALTGRGFSGPVRCMFDSALDRPWICYPLQLPDVPHAGDELLYLSLLLADSVARHTICGLLDGKIDSNQSLPDDYVQLDPDEWQEVRDALSKSHLPENPIGGLFDQDVRYHLLKRSCTTMALQTLDWGAKRIHKRGGLPEPKSIRVAPDDMPDIVKPMVNGERTSTLLQLPSAVQWLMKHQTVVPGQAHKLLDEVGMLQQEDGEPMRRHYDNREVTAYGTISEQVIY